MKNKVITLSKNAAPRRAARGGPPPLATPLPCDHVRVIQVKALYDDYLCLVASKKQQIQW